MWAVVVAVAGAAVSVSPVLALAVISAVADAGLCIFCCPSEPLIWAWGVASAAGDGAASLSLL